MKSAKPQEEDYSDDPDEAKPKEKKSDQKPAPKEVKQSKKEPKVEEEDQYYDEEEESDEEFGFFNDHELQEIKDKEKARENKGGQAAKEP